MGKGAMTHSAIVLEGDGLQPCISTRLCPDVTSFAPAFSAVQNGPEEGHSICILTATFTYYVAGEMQI